MIEQDVAPVGTGYPHRLAGAVERVDSRLLARVCAPYQLLPPPLSHQTSFQHE